MAVDVLAMADRPRRQDRHLACRKSGQSRAGAGMADHDVRTLEGLIQVGGGKGADAVDVEVGHVCRADLPQGVHAGRQHLPGAVDESTEAVVPVSADGHHRAIQGAHHIGRFDGESVEHRDGVAPFLRCGVRVLHETVDPGHALHDPTRR